MAQYDFQYPKYIEGTEMGTLIRSDSHVAKTIIYPGTAVKLDKDTGEVVAWNTVGYENAPFYGIATRTGALYNDLLSEIDYYRVGQMVTVSLTNDIPVKTSVAVKISDKAYCDAETGLFTNVATGNGEAIGSFRDSGAANDLVKIHIDQL